MRISRVMLIILSVALLVSASFLFTACGSSGGGGGGGDKGTIKGTLTIDIHNGDTDGKMFAVFVDDNQDPSDGMVTQMPGASFPSSASTNYSITDVPDGTYYVYVGIYAVSPYPGPLAAGDYLGAYGATGYNTCFDIFTNAQTVTVSGGGTAMADITVYELTSCF